MVTNNLYPPIMPNVIPGFIRTSAVKIYFSISEYNSVKDIANVQITLTDIKTNSSALNTSLYPSGIKLTELKYDSTIKDDYCYYIVIEPADLKTTTGFGLNQYYKLQMRFTSTQAEFISLSTPQSISTWLYDNMMFFSEWSRSCLLRGISKFTIKIDNLNSDAVVTLSAPLSKITGELTFQDTGEKDYLAEYSVKVYRAKKNTLIFNSSSVYPDADQENIVDCDLLCNFESDESYYIIFNFTTHYLYNQQIEYKIKMKAATNTNPLKLSITATPCEQDGYINVFITRDRSVSSSAFQNKEISLRRASSKDNFQTLEKLLVMPYEGESAVLFKWPDLSIEHGVWYQYSLYVSDATNYSLLYAPIKTQPVLCAFEDIFLLSNNMQFRLQFNPTVTGFKYNVSESQQITLGSKFPYIKRNGNNYYRSFSISGLVSSLTDDVDWYDSYLFEKEDADLPHFPFTSKEKEYGTSYDLYTNYESEHSISNYLNPIYERFFREAIYSFLYTEDIKLFKSPTEGNILVKLVDISFEPIASLGRVLYSFSATAIEIDEATFDNFKKYNVFEKSVELVTESPGYEFSDGVLTINANGISNAKLQKRALYLEHVIVNGGRIV